MSVKQTYFEEVYNELDLAGRRKEGVRNNALAFSGVNCLLM